MNLINKTNNFNNVIDRCRLDRLQKEDKRKACFVYLEDACERFPDYSAGEILYTVFRHVAKANGVSVSFLRNMTNDEIFKEMDLRFFEEGFK